MTALCILCKAGGPLAAVCAVGFLLAGKAIGEAGPSARVSAGVRVLLGLLLLGALLGPVACSVRADVCEAAP